MSKKFMFSSCLIFFNLCFQTMANDNSQKYQKNKFELDDFQKYVIEKNGTEPAFQNKYWDHKEEGIYVDASSGEPLFSSLDKFDSGSGCPSYTIST